VPQSKTKTKTRDQRPPVAVGHVRFNVSDVGAAARWLETVGLRPIVTRDELAVLELRGGTHVVVRQVEQPPAPGAGAPFDLMVDDVDAAHRDYAEKGLSPSPVRRGRIHDSFELADPMAGPSPSIPRTPAANRSDGLRRSATDVASRLAGMLFVSRRRAGGGPKEAPVAIVGGPR